MQFLRACFYRNLATLGLAVEYKSNTNVTCIVRKLFALPFLPHRKIQQVFFFIKAEANTQDPRVINLFQYFERTWLRHVICSQRNICVYHRLVRTNNDVEVYHNRLGEKCRSDHPPFYVLMEVLYSEARLCNVNAKLVSNQAVKMHQKKRPLNSSRKLKLSGNHTMRI